MGEDSDKRLYIAKNYPMTDLVTHAGFTPIPQGGKYILKEHDSFVIFPDTNSFCHYSQIKSNGRPSAGSTVDFCVNYMDMTVKEAFDYLLDLSGYDRSKKDFTVYTPKNLQQKVVKGHGPLILPEANDNNHRVYAYLHQTRGIGKDVINTFVKEGRLYESKDYHNCVFVTRDEKGNPKYAFQRGTNPKKSFKRDVKGTDKSYGFPVVKRGSNQILCFEAPIDLMSYMTLYPNNKSHLISLGCLSTGALDRFLEDHMEITKVGFLLDNDAYAPAAAKRASEDLISRGYEIIGHELNVKMREENVKDINEYLLATRSIQPIKLSAMVL